MASIVGFLDHFDVCPVQHAVPRASLRHQQPRRRESVEPGNVLLWLLVAILHVGLFLVLEFAMRPSVIIEDAAEEPLQVTFISMPAPSRVTAQPVAQADTQRTPHPQRASSQADTALQAVFIPQRAAMPADSRPRLDLYDAQAHLLLSAPATMTRADPFARRAASDMLPGSDRERVHGIHVRAETSAQDVAEKIGAYFGGGHFDPCPEYEQRLVNADNETERDEQVERYSRACPGR